MAHSKQAQKRIRQNEKRRLRNRARSSAMKTLVKKLEAAAAAGDTAAAQALLPTVFKNIDKAAKTNVIHKNTAARKKARMAKLAAGASA